MSRDRLAALRAERGGAERTSIPPPVTSEYHPETQHELAPMPPYGGNEYNTADDLSAFHEEISAIEDKITEYKAQVGRISALHNHSLSVTDDNVLQQDTALLETVQRDTSALSGEIKRRIQVLEAQSGKSASRDVKIRSQHTGRVKKKFMEAVQDFQRSEQEYRAKYRTRVERQFKIVKPNATAEEIRAVVDDPDQGGQIFSNAVATSNRYGESRAAYREVQDRHQDLKRIENTLAELAQLFNDLATSVAQDDEKIEVIEQQAQVADNELEQGLGHTERAVDHARAARKKRIYCFLIILAILAVIGIVVAIAVTQATK